MSHRYGSPRSPYHGIPMPEIVDAKRLRRMTTIDNLSPALRTLVHEYGWTVVKTLMDLGIKKPHQLRHAVETVLGEFSPTRGTFSQQGIRGEILKPSKDPAIT